MDSETITATGHDYVTTSTVAPSCTEGGYTVQECNNCGDSITTGQSEATGHTEVTTRVEPQLGVNGYILTSCSVCGESLSEELIPMLMTDGVDSVYYINLGKGETTFVIGHYDEAEAERLNQLCNEYRAVVDANDPDFSYGPMCSNDVVKGYADTRAVETSYRWEHTRPNGSGPFRGTNENIAWIPPTNTVLTDADAVMEGWIASEGHESNLSITGDNGAVESGVFCKRCEISNQPGTYVYEKYYVQLYYFTSTLESLHVESAWIVDKEASCIEAGSKHIECTVCNAVLKTEEIPATEHTSGDWVVDVDPGCTSDGSKHLVCSVCGETMDSETITATGHDYVTTSTVAPSCTEGGYTVQECNNCGDSITTGQSEATGHTEVTTRVEPQLGVVGSVVTSCSVCGETLNEETIPMLMTDGVDSVYYINLGKGETTFVIGHYDEAEAERLNQLCNEYRAVVDANNTIPGISYGPMCSNDNLKGFADIRAVETSYQWSHTRPNGSGTFRGTNENIAWIPPTNTVLTDADAVMESWIASEGHESNLSIPGDNGAVESGVFCKRCEISNQPGNYVYEKYYVQLYSFPGSND